MLSSILAAIAAIPAILAELKALNAAFQKAEDAGWFDKEKSIFIKLDKPTTSQQKVDLAKALADITANS